MSRPIFLCVLAAFAVSLWFNLRSHRGPAAQAPQAMPVEAPGPILAGKIEEMDFSGTGLSDESWQLKPEALGETIPEAIPAEGNGLAAPAPAPVPPDWDVDKAIRLAPGETPEKRP